MVWFYEIAEREHEIQNPTSPEKIRLLGERMRLGPNSHLLDVASGQGGPALLLAREFGCRIRCVERFEGFADIARERSAVGGLEGLIEVITADARDVRLAPGAYDAVLCLGASFIWDGLAGTLEALLPAVRPGGYVAVGEPYWRSWPLPRGIDNAGYVALPEAISRFEDSGAAVVSLIASSQDDWDRYESLHWQACEEWLADNADTPNAEEIRADYLSWKERYLTAQRDLLGWAIFVGLKSA